MTPLVFAAVPALLALVLWAILDLENFVMFAVLGVMILPASLAKPGGANIAAVDVLLLIAGASWLINNSLGRAPDPWIKRNPMFIPALLFIAVSAASLTWSVKPGSTLVFTIQLIEITLVFPLIFATLPRSSATIRRAFIMLIALTTVMAVVALAYFAAHPNAQSQGTYLPGLNKNALGSFVAAGAMLAYALWLEADGTKPKMLLALGFVVNVGGVVASVSRAAMVGAAVAVLVISLLLGRRRLLTMTVAGALATVLIVFIAPTVATKATTSGGYDSTVVRQYAWEGAVKKIEQHPLLGTGGKTYSDNLAQIPSVTLSDPDNLFLFTWAELGLAGMAALVFMLVRFGLLLVRARSLPRDASVLAVAAGGVSLSLFVHFQFDVSWTRGTTSLAFAMIGLMLALTRLSTASVTSLSEAEPALLVAEPPIPVGSA